MTGDEIREKAKRYLMPSVIQYYAEPVAVASASGVRVRDADGRDYLDFFGGILTVSLAHAEPNVVSAVRVQVERLVAFLARALAESAGDSGWGALWVGLDTYRHREPRRGPHTRCEANHHRRLRLHPRHRLRQESKEHRRDERVKRDGSREKPCDVGH